MNQILERNLDLNLLRVLVAVARTGSVSKAAEALCLSQPATSNALARLREATGDALFERTPDGMRPTPYAEAIVPQVEAHLSALIESLSQSKGFDPASSTRDFRVSMSGLGELTFLPAILRAMWQAAPETTLRCVPTAAGELAPSLSARRIDFALGILGAPSGDLRAETLFEERYVAVAGTGLAQHPTSQSQLRDCAIAITTPQMSYGSDIEALLERNQLTANVSLRLANFGAIPSLLETLPLVAIVPRGLSALLQAEDRAQVLPIALAQTPRPVRLVWHARQEDEPAHRWLRKLIVGVLAKGRHALPEATLARLNCNN
ncbi:LysR family transcriptional regulator [Pseudaestuariivita sp.]|uniref:LysR family transcriptional regulator n=1 Tax=Pseudaestuariivita sp. TaxID=2211669 RepID=UPI00405964C7